MKLQPNRTIARVGLGVVLPTVILFAGYLPYLLLRDRLADRVATHFDIGGTPDGSMTVAGLLITTSLMMCLGIALCVGVALSGRRHLSPMVQPLAGFMGAFIAAIGSGILGSTVLAQRDVADWTEAGAPWWMLVWAIGGGLLVGAIAAHLAADLATPHSEHGSTEPLPTMGLRPTENAMWTQSMHTRWLQCLGAAMIVGGAMAGFVSRWWIALSPIFIGAAVLALATVRVSVDRRGLRVFYGPFSWPRTTVSLGRVEEASVIDVRPREWGGWGYRGSLTLMKRAAVVQRAGPGIRLDLSGGKVFVVTVDDPAEPVALINSELARQPS